MARHNRKHEQRKRNAEKKAAPRHKRAVSVNKEELTACCNKIRTFLNQNGRKAMTAADLSRKCHSRRAPEVFRLAMEKLMREGVILECRGGYVLSEKRGCFPAQVMRLSHSFGFIKDENDVEYFVPGKFLMGSMPGDRVLASHIESRTGSPEAEVVSVLQECEEFQLTGKIVPEEEGLCLLPDTMSSTPLRIDYRESIPYTVGDKVLAVLTKRGKRHMEHRVKVILNFGSAVNSVVPVIVDLPSAHELASAKTMPPEPIDSFP